MCERCPELEAEIAELRAELGRPDEEPVVLATMARGFGRQEARILIMLESAGGNLVNRFAIVDRLGLRNEAAKNIDVYISKLRRKLGRDAIVTFRGLGFGVARPEVAA